MFLTLFIPALSCAEGSTDPEPLPAITVSGKLMEEKNPRFTDIVSFNQSTVEVKEKKYFPANDVFFECELTGNAIIDPSEVILINQKKIDLTGETSFKYNVRVESSSVPIEISWVSKTGKVYTQSFHLEIEDFEKLSKTLSQKRDKKLQLSAQLGGTSASLLQPGSITDRSQSTLMTLKLAGELKLGSGEWIAYLSGIANVLPFFLSYSRTQVDPDNAPAGVTQTATASGYSYTGGNLSVSRSLPWLKSPWHLRIAAGYSFLSLLTDQAIGFSVFYPQIYPMIEYAFANTSLLKGYIKFSPIAHGVSFQSISSNEFASGVQFEFPKKPGKKLSYGLSFDFSTESLILNDDSSGASNTRSILMTLSGVVFL